MCLHVAGIHYANLYTNCKSRHHHLVFINEEVEAKVVQQGRAGRFAAGSAELFRSLAVCRR